MTKLQQPRFDLLLEAAQEVKSTNPEFSQSYEAEEMESQGYEVLGGQSVPVADLETGSQFIGTVDGKKDTWNVKGEHNGNIILQDGVKKEVDMFDSVKVDGIKPGPQIDKNKQKFIDNQIKILKTVEAVDKKYSGKDPVSVYARAKVREANNTPAASDVSANRGLILTSQIRNQNKNRAIRAKLMGLMGLSQISQNPNSPPCQIPKNLIPRPPANP